MDCPTCGKTLSTEQGTRQHHTKVHGDPLPNRTCADCGTEFYDPKSRRTYCDDCYSQAGEKNGNYSGAKETTDCKQCGDTFDYYPSNKDGVYCSDCVAEADEFLGTPYAETVDVERIERTCDYCDEPMVVLECNRRQGHGRFCSNDCQNAWMSDQYGDGEAVYNGRWREVRRKALERDDYRCQKCGATARELGQNPDVHHIKPVRTFDDPQNAHTVDNLIALCKSCHAYAEHGNMELLPPS
ncbi:MULTISPECIES: HNH endonuclease [Halobacterium]|uniref:HNH endonuclease n=1 Tax=Halobacterium TaxID=2239 RepID=UPI00073EB580|nr:MULTISPECIES: HNH endonuclease signature motif containing protein [Halobacterium]MCG1002550.1 HNH endonuclease [Halobacterium noricense]